MSMGFLVLEEAARRGDVLATVENLLDELKARGAPGVSDRIHAIRGRIMDIARLRSGFWLLQPEVALLDFYARTLNLTDLDEARHEWDATLDARGPWLRPLRPWFSEFDVVAELPASEDLPLGRLPVLRFEGEDTVVFGLLESSGEALLWAWGRGGLLSRTGLEPVEQRYGSLSDTLARQLGNLLQLIEGRGHPLPDFCPADVLRRHEFDHGVSAVIRRPGTRQYLVGTNGGQVIIGPDGVVWTRAGRADGLAWSPSGRYVCMADAHGARILDTQAKLAPPGHGGMPTTFSPDGARLIDGSELLDGRSGASIARLDVRLGEYLEGGPAWPWWHVGTDFVVCIHTGLQLWDTQSGDIVQVGDRLHVSIYESIACSRSGRHFVRTHGRQVELVQLPSGAVLSLIDFGLGIEALALSDGADFIAAYGGGALEVRDRKGALLATGQLPTPRVAERYPLIRASFNFSADGRRLRLQIPEQHVSSWSAERGESSEVRARVECEWAIDGKALTLMRGDVEAHGALPSGWTVEDGPISVFAHASGAYVFVPCGGPWVAHASAPNIVACPGGMFELRA